jgi:hypothetical protein
MTFSLVVVAASAGEGEILEGVVTAMIARHDVLNGGPANGGSVIGY